MGARSFEVIVMRCVNVPSMMSFLAMSVDVTIAGIGISSGELNRAADAARNAAAHWEAIFSRFRPDSDLCRLNEANGAPLPVSRTFIDVLEVALTGIRQTDGRFDPAILPALEAAGYDRPFEALPGGDPLGVALQAAPVTGHWIDRVTIDRSRSEVALPPGVRIDLGGIAKGAFVDEVTAQLTHWPGGFVDAGGDLRVWGESSHGRGWKVAVEDPADPERDVVVIELDGASGQAVATSGPSRRNWRRGQSFAHHLIDPRSGLPAPATVQSVTAVAATVAAAEIETKSLFVAASRGMPPALISGHAAVLIHNSGVIEVISHAHSDSRPVSPFYETIPAA